jgi:hypothetical protein
MPTPIPLPITPAKSNINLINFQPFWSILGVLVGFLLGEGTRYFRYKIRILRLKRVVREELKTIIMYTNLKIDFIETKLLELLRNKKIPTGNVTKTITIGFNHHFSELYEYFSPIQRMYLHLIYQNIEVGEQTLSSIKNDLISTLNSNIFDDPYQPSILTLESTIELYKNTKSLIEEYLKNKCIDRWGILKH